MACAIIRPGVGLILYISVLSFVAGFNVDTKIPVIKIGQNGSYFGYAVAQHMYTGKKLILAGAPLADNPTSTHKDQSPQGGLLQCNAENWNEKDCAYIGGIEDMISNAGSFKNQWMGSTIMSGGPNKRVVVCAHRYTIDYVGTGTCVLLDDRLVPDEEKRPCNDDGRENKGIAYCQAGTSGILTAEDVLVLGAPGAVDWTGGLYKHYVGEDLSKDFSWTRSAIYEAESGYKKPPVDKTSVLGMAVTYGKFDSLQDMMFVGGAPRSNSVGQVVMFVPASNALAYRENQVISGTQPFSAFGYALLAVDLNNDNYDDLIVGSPMYLDENVGGAIYVYKGGADGINNYTKPMIITNKMSAEECKKRNCLDARFGNSLAKAGDINQDGFDDFVVGAPYESNRGAIYIYHGSADGVKEEYSQRIAAEDINNNLKTFGWSLSGGLDMDDNGYPDILVGAYASDSAVLLRSRPIVHMNARTNMFPERFNLTNKPYCPVDKSAHHCVQINLCLTYTAKPVASFGSLDFTYTIVVEPTRQKKRGMFKNKMPSKPAGDVVTRAENLKVQSREQCFGEILYLKPEKEFQDNDKALDIKITYTIPETPLPTPIPFFTDQAIPDINKHPVLQLGGQVGEATASLETSIKFAICGDDDLCKSQLMMDVEVLLPVENGIPVITNLENDIEMRITLANLGEEPAKKTTLIFIVPEDFERSWERPIYNEDPVPEFKKYSPNCYTHNVTILACKGVGDPLYPGVTRKMRVKFDMKKLDPNTREFDITVVVNTTSKDKVPFIKRSFTIKIVNRANVQLLGSSEPDRDVIYKGPVIGESAISREAQIGPAIVHNYQILVDGHGTMPEAELQIQWPYELKGRSPGDRGKRLLYLMEPPKVMKGRAECIVQPDLYNPLSVDSQGPSYNTITERRKRTVRIRAKREEDGTSTNTPMKEEEDSKVRLAEQRERKQNVVQLDCRIGNVQCHLIKCKIGRMNKGSEVEIKIRARLWQGTLVEDYPSVDMVKILSRGEILLDPDINIQQSSIADDQAEAITYAIPDVVSEARGEIQWWIILVAILGGIVLLVILILILLKLGFFRRLKPKDYEPTYTGEIKKKPNDIE